MFIDLTAAYDTVWHRGLACKLLRLLPDRHMVKVMMDLVYNRSFTLTNGFGGKSRLRRLKNGVPQGSVLAPILFSIYINDLSPTTSKLYAYADDLTIVHSTAEWSSLEKTLNQDMAILSLYLQIWRLKFSKSKTVSTAFHLNNMEAKRELNIIVDEMTCPTILHLSILESSWTGLSRIDTTWRPTLRIALICRL